MAVSSDVKLRIYNGALRRLGARSLASLSEDREPRRVLDEAWGSADEMIYWALERGEWNFALRTVQADYSPDIEPSFGFRRAFDKPSDFRRLASISTDEYFRSPMVDAQYVDEARYWFTDYDVLYIRYVSDGTTYGMNSAGWTEVFKEFLEMKLAYECCERLTNSKPIGDRVQREYGIAMRDAKSLDSMNEGTKFLPHGSWSRSRSGGSSNGERSRLR